MDASEDEKTQTLASVLGVEDLNYCRRLLEAHGFDLEATVNTALSVGPAGGGDHDPLGAALGGNAPFPQAPPAPAPRPARQAAGGAPPTAHRRDRIQRHQPRVDANNNPVLGLPVAIVRASFGLVFAVVGFGFKVRATPCSCVCRTFDRGVTRSLVCLSQVTEHHQPRVVSA